MRLLCLVRLWLWSQLGALAAAKRTSSIVLYSIDFTLVKQSAINMTAKVIQYPPLPQFSAEIMFPRQVDDVQALASLVVLRKDNTKFPILTQDLSFCRFLQLSIQPNVLLVVAREMRRASNFPPKCPFKGNFMYRINNFTLNTDLFPPNLPPMFWVLKFAFRIGKIPVLNVTVKGNINRH